MKNERGFTLLEVLISIALIGMIAVAVCYALATVSKALLVTDLRGTAETLAIKQMEYIRNQPYSDNPWNYTVSSSEEPSASPEPSWWADDSPSRLSGDYANYVVEAYAENFEEREGIRKIIVNIYNLNTDDLIIELECYKVDRYQ